jgi:hypothetical protein
MLKAAERRLEVTYPAAHSKTCEEETGKQASIVEPILIE